MKPHAALAAFAAAAALFLTTACDTSSDTEIEATPPPSAASSEPQSIPGQDEGVDPSESADEVDPGESAEADPDASGDTTDTGLINCRTIINNTQADKLPLPINETPAYYINVKNGFSKSRYVEVKKAGEDFVDEYVAAIKAGGKNADKLSDAATDLVKACNKYL